MSYSVIVADPPWSFNDKLPGLGRGAQKHYKVMSLSDIKNFVLPVIASNAYLFLWRVASQVEESYQVVRAWGFTAKSELIWLKRTKNDKRWFGMGHHVRAEHEVCIIAVKGSPKPRVRNIRSTFEAKAGKHSQKPEEFFDIIEELCYGPYVELFARRQRSGWTCLGDQIIPGHGGRI